MKQKFTIYVHAYTDSYSRGELTIMAHSDMSEYGYTLISTHEVELDIPEFALVQIQVEGIDKTIAKVRAEAEAKVTQLMGRKQELLALRHDGGGQQ